MLNDKTETAIAEKEILSRKELTEFLGKSQPTIWKWVKQGFLREHRLGRTVFYLKSEILEDIKKRGAL